MAEVQNIQRYKLRSMLEPWREVVLCVGQVLYWKKPWHPTAILGANTILFTLLWLLNPSMLTMFALLGLGLTFADYFMPSLVATRWLFRDYWTAVNDEEFESFCTDLVILKLQIELTIGSYNRLKITHKKTHFFGTIFILAYLAWLGSYLNNMLLVYLTSSILLLAPGLIKSGTLEKWLKILKLDANGSIYLAMISFLTPKKQQ